MPLGLPHDGNDPTKATPFSLVYGCEVVLPLKTQIPSLRVALKTEPQGIESFG